MGWPWRLPSVFKNDGTTMRLLSKISGWLSSLWHFVLGSKPQTVLPPEATSFYHVDFAEDLPEIIADNSIFVIQDGNEPELLAFKCPCGCQENILLNLLGDTSPQWHFRVNANGIINVHPSIWRTVGCKSHFWIIDGNVKWV